MLADCAVIGFIPVADLARAEAFFHGKLGLRVLQPNDGFALVLGAAGGATIRCVRTADHRPLPSTILGWEVADIQQAVQGLAAAGVEPIRYPHFEQGEDGVWTAPRGHKVVWFHDPDGNVLSLSQHGR